MNKKEIICIYEKVLNGKLEKFPEGFFDRKKNRLICIKYLIEEVLRWDEEDIKKNISIKVFKENKLYIMITNYYNSSPYEAIREIYKDIKPWQLTKTPRNFWRNPHNRTIAIKWLIEEKLQWDDNDIKENLSVHVFRDNGLFGLINKYYNSSPYEAIRYVYPHIKAWDLDREPRNMWMYEDDIAV